MKQKGICLLQLRSISKIRTLMCLFTLCFLRMQRGVSRKLFFYKIKILFNISNTAKPWCRWSVFVVREAVKSRVCIVCKVRFIINLLSNYERDLLQSGFFTRKNAKIRQIKLFLLRWSAFHLTQFVLIRLHCIISTSSNKGNEPYLKTLFRAGYMTLNFWRTDDYYKKLTIYLSPLFTVITLNLDLKIVNIFNCSRGKNFIFEGKIIDRIIFYIISCFNHGHR